jgi:choice-of-anchor A domain-containing protein
MKLLIRIYGIRKLIRSRNKWMGRGLSALIIMLLLSGPALAVGIDLGQAGPVTWNTLELGGGNVTMNVNTIAGTQKSIGIVGPPAGTITFTATGSTFTGTTYEGTGVTNSWISSSTGPLVQPADTLLNAAKADALSFATVYKNTPATDPLNNINLTGTQTMTVTGTTGLNVYNLTDLKMQDTTLLKITGPVGSTFVFNISGTFNITSGSLSLGPGVSPDDILFNVTGSTDVLISSVIFRGLLLAPQVNVGINHASWIGEVIAGKNLTLDHSTVNNPTDTAPLPASILLLGSGLLGMGLFGWRKKYMKA